MPCATIKTVSQLNVELLVESDRLGVGSLIIVFVFDLYELEKLMDNLHYYPSFSISSMLVMILFQESRLQSGSIEFISFNKQNLGLHLN